MNRDDDGHLYIPVAFWRSMSKAEMDAFDGTLNAEQCARLWRLTDRQGQAPESMELEFNLEAMLRLCPPRTRRERQLAAEMRRKAR